MANKKQRVLIGLSGGVDSAVSAYLLLKAGYEIEGAFMKNWSSTAGLKVADCPWLQDRQEALRVAAHLGIPLHTLDFEHQYSKNVMDYFFREYKAGRTPNPDVMCNKEIKFKLLYNWAIKNGFDYLATGHYAQIAESRVMNHESGKLQSTLSVSRRDISPKGGEKDRKPHASRLTPHYSLMRSRDEFKDQTYFIYNIKQEQLPHVLFPIGGMKKPEVKKLAKKIGLPNAHRKESMGLCFVGKIRLKDFLEQKVKAKPGKIMLESRIKNQESSQLQPTLSVSQLDISPKGGEKDRQSHSSLLTPQAYTVLGTHSGLHNYTIGQRQGIRVGGGDGPYYVLRKDLKKNILYVTQDANDPALEVREVELHSVNWITAADVSNETRALSNTKKHLGSRLTAHTSLLARYRHQGELVPCTIEKQKKDTYLVKFKTPQKALASGQSVVLYSGKMCLGGGAIA